MHFNAFPFNLCVRNSGGREYAESVCVCGWWISTKIFKTAILWCIMNLWYYKMSTFWTISIRKWLASLADIGWHYGFVSSHCCPISIEVDFFVTNLFQSFHFERCNNFAEWIHDRHNCEFYNVSQTKHQQWSSNQQHFNDVCERMNSIENASELTEDVRLFFLKRWISM